MGCCEPLGFKSLAADEDERRSCKKAETDIEKGDEAAEQADKNRESDQQTQQERR